ncbi:NAD(P)/FAD-dependent oxidoreductase [Clostridium sp. M62/1]|uniref:NAD(P)/FAD-dependent oxidoreductase n=1 Tax=Clostridium sp. M62/1 TaxID=411486 RepID=UPI003568A578
MIRINQLKLPVNHKKQDLQKKAAKLLRQPETRIRSLHIRRQSIDARKKGELLYIYAVDVEFEGDEESAVRRAKNVNITISKEKRYQFPEAGREAPRLKERPVIIGCGPAGLFCGLMLARAGYRPVILERGADVDTRTAQVKRFWEEGILDPESNVQFGEGGAGTFSDGKLNTLVKDVSGRNGEVLRILTEAGADPSILYSSKPHVGTDVLARVVKHIRTEITSLGGEVRFQTKAADLGIRGGKAAFVETEHPVRGREVIPAEAVVLAVGHSARDTFEVLYKKGIEMEAKAFAVGLRIQHPQKQINLAQYGMEEPGELGAAPYKVTRQTSNGRGVYSFCMCPGGYVVNASSEPGRLAVNGMSYHSREGVNANSALIVTVTADDFPEATAMGGIAFQRQLEEAAFRAGGGNIPVQLYGDFRDGRVSRSFGDVEPAFMGGTAFADLNQVLPAALCASFREGMEAFGKMIRGFDRPDAILAGVESRTSSPLRIGRGETLEGSIGGLYPCGEGAGYAGGITSAAMDGIKVAEAIVRRFQRPEN